MVSKGNFEADEKRKMNGILRAAPKAAGGRLRSERGFTVPELAMTIIILAVLAAAAMTFVVTSSNQYAGQQDRVQATDDARNALARMTSELRDATSVQLVDSRTVDATVRNADGSLTNIRFSCALADGDLSECSRTDIAANSTEVLIDRVKNVENFSSVLGSDRTGTTSLNGALRIELDVELSDVSNAEHPFNLVATVKPRNCIPAPATGVLNPPC